MANPKPIRSVGDGLPLAEVAAGVQRFGDPSTGDLPDDGELLAGSQTDAERTNRIDEIRNGLVVDITSL